MSTVAVAEVRAWLVPNGAGRSDTFAVEIYVGQVLGGYLTRQIVAPLVREGATPAEAFRVAKAAAHDALSAKDVAGDVMRAARRAIADAEHTGCTYGRDGE